MPAPNAWNADFPDDVILDFAVLDYDLGAGTRGVVGMTRGGNNFVSGEERRHFEADGLRHRVLGGSRIARWVDTRFEGTLVQLPFAIVEKFLPSTNVAAGTPAVTTYTPVAAGTVLVAANMLLKPRLTWQRGDGGSFAIEFPYGEVGEFPGITAPDLNEATFAYRILAVVDPGSVGYTSNVAPYKVITTAAA